MGRRATWVVVACLVVAALGFVGAGYALLASIDLRKRITVLEGKTKVVRVDPCDKPRSRACQRRIALTLAALPRREREALLPARAITALPRSGAPASRAPTARSSSERVERQLVERRTRTEHHHRPTIIVRPGPEPPRPGPLPRPPPIRPPVSPPQRVCGLVPPAGRRLVGC